MITGIASPGLIHNYLKVFFKNVEVLEYSDHYNFSDRDIVTIMKKFEKIDDHKKIIVTTEKDAMRFKDMDDLPEEFKNRLYYLPVKVQFLEDKGESFDKKILNYVGENKSNRELHKKKDKHLS